MTEDEAAQKDRQRLYERVRDDLAVTGRSISESYDRALLTLSSAFLGGSLAFIGKVVELSTATHIEALYAAWAFFALTILLTLASFIYGLFTMQPLRDAAERYYMRRDETAWNVIKAIQNWVLGFSVACGVSFALGIFLMSWFVFINLSETSMAEKSKAPERVEKSIPPATFQKPHASGAQKPGSNTPATNPKAGTSSPTQKPTGK